MSGIVGIVNLDDAPIDREQLQRMTMFMSFRGPDAQDVWIDANAGLGHTLLRATRDTAPAKQPLTLDGNAWLIADARIDAQLEPTDDAEAILRAYHAWGEDCVNHLLGDFAFAIWNKRERRLFCARDHFGVKPFFFAHLPNTFIFGNTLNALRLDRRVSDALNEIALGDFLLFGLNQNLSTTTFRDIQRLPAGHALSLGGGSLTIKCYWTPSAQNEIRLRNSRSYVERFDELLTAATADRLRADRVSVSMSGGLDSTSIAVIARDQLLGAPAPAPPKSEAFSNVQAYTAVYDDLIPDEERHYSTLAATSLGIPIHHLQASDYSLFEGDLDQPEPFLVSPFSKQFHDLLRLCAGTSRVALTGFDGDALMTEPPRSWFASAARQLRIKDLLAGLSRFVWSQRRLPPIGLRAKLKQLLGKQPSETYWWPEWIDESFARRTHLRERWNNWLSETVAFDEKRPSTLHALHSKVWASLFEGYDSGSTRLLLEVRHPLIDVRVVDYLLAIPAVPWCVNKHILRRAMKDRLPAAILNRPKTPLAGDPALQLSRDAGVRWRDSFAVTPKLAGFVNLNCRRSLADDKTPEAVWANLRLFALNHWLTHSLPIERRMVA